MNKINLSDHRLENVLKAIIRNKITKEIILPIITKVAPLKSNSDKFTKTYHATLRFKMSKYVSYIVSILNCSLLNLVS